MVSDCSSAGEEDMENIKKGMKLIEHDTCVRFVPRTHQRDYLDIQPKTGYWHEIHLQWLHHSSILMYLLMFDRWYCRCWSYLGARGGRQTISLQTPECTGSGVTVHELMHALGLVHEQSRADRDKYVTIMWSNIWKGKVAFLYSHSLILKSHFIAHLFFCAFK